MRRKFIFSCVVFALIFSLSACGASRNSYTAKEKVSELAESFNKKVVQPQTEQLSQRPKALQAKTLSVQPLVPQTQTVSHIREPKPPFVDKLNITKPDAIGVIIGNSGYAKFKNGIPNVDYAIQDSRAIEKLFIFSLGLDPQNIIYVEDATQAALFSVFGTEKNPKGKLFNWIKANKSEVYIYYTGHGAPSLEKKGAFLVPVDASANYLTETSYPLDLLYQNIEQLPSTRNTVIIDACFSGESQGGVLYQNVSPALFRTATHIKKLKKSRLISSTSMGELSNWYPAKNHSLFTYYLLEALSGKADINADKKITLSELEGYVCGEVSYKARRLSGREQTPVFMAEDMESVFIRF